MSQLVGAKLVADFGAHGLFVGQVQEFCSATGHLVKYEDGDEEWIKDILKDPDVRITKTSSKPLTLPSRRTRSNTKRNKHIASKHSSHAEAQRTPKREGQRRRGSSVLVKKETGAEAVVEHVLLPTPKLHQSRCPPDTVSPPKRTKRKAPASNTGDLSEYEMKRLENIRQNNAILEGLGLSSAGITLTRARISAVSSMRPKTRHKRVKRSRVATRTSLRVRGMRPDGSALPDDFKPLTRKHFSFSPAEPEVIEGDVELDRDGQAFLDALMAGDDSAESEVQLSDDAIAYARRLASLRVHPEHGVRKVTPDRIYSLSVSPSTSALAVAAGDKNGNFGLWVVKARRPGESDGVLRCRPHSSVVAGIAFDPANSNKVYTSSYDGRICALDIGSSKGKFTQVFNASADYEFYQAQPTGDGKSLFVSTHQGALLQLDVRSKAAVVNDWALHDKKIYTVSLRQPDERYLATSSLDRSVAVWDVRNMTRPVHVLPSALASIGAEWSPDGSRLLTIANDNSIKCFSASLCENKWTKNSPPAKPAHHCFHNNHTGRWLTKFSVRWDPKHRDAFVVGSMDKPRCIEVYSGECKRLMRLRDDCVASVQSLNEFHPKLDIIASANASGRVHVWRKE